MKTAASPWLTSADANSGRLGRGHRAALVLVIVVIEPSRDAWKEIS